MEILNIIVIAGGSGVAGYVAASLVRDKAVGELRERLSESLTRNGTYRAQSEEWALKCGEAQAEIAAIRAIKSDAVSRGNRTRVAKRNAQVSK
jgi:hypothetical protein